MRARLPNGEAQAIFHLTTLKKSIQAVFPFVILVVNTENNEKCMLFYRSQVWQDNSWLRAPPMCIWTGKDKLQYIWLDSYTRATQSRKNSFVHTFISVWTQANQRAIFKPKRNQSRECKEREPAEKPFLHFLIAPDPTNRTAHHNDAFPTNSSLKYMISHMWPISKQSLCHLARI